ncbi:two-component system OmpR family response regulator [Agrobacterium vitis]|nr:two-component system OmpR family response regulator [Agrobacterium vitis]MBE1440357.1 two-component system OmpR family response regulator [Agrobacterium vitis]
MNSANRIPHILIVEDDPEIGALLAETMRENGMNATTVEDGNEMFARMRQFTFDLIILDVMLPGEDGISLCRRLRSEKTIPIILVTSLGEEVDRIVGLEVGADDYITKPFSPREVVARIRSALRRASYGLATPDRQIALRFDGWRIDPVRRQVHDSTNARISLTTTEFDLLLAFCRNPGRVITREELLSLTHTGLAGPIERSVDVHIRRLRQKIETDASDPVLLKTVRLGGYVFTATVVEA